MTRREPGTAVAWVGIVILSPIFGALAYFLLGVNRISRRAQEVRGRSADAYRMLLPKACAKADVVAALGSNHEHLTQVAVLGDVITDRPLLHGNRISLLRNGDEAYPAMIAAIDEAEHSISLVSYIFDYDQAGKLFCDALARANERGVAVRILIDDVGARYSFPPTVRRLRRDGIRSARFMPALFHWRMPYFNLRNHRKIMVIDGKTGFTGGMNIREGFWKSLSGEDHGADLHFRVEGPVVSELQEVFAQDWTFSARERLEGDIWFPEIAPAGSTVARGIADGPDVDFEKLQTIILGAIAASRQSITILTPYFIPDVRMQSALTIAAGRGVDVVIILPSRVNLVLVQWASTAYWEELLRAGCRIVVTPPPFDHGKLMLVDDAWTLFGSANLDPRSLQLNFEFNVECYDSAVAQEARRELQVRLEIGREVTLQEIRERPLRVKFRDRLARLFSAYL
ncbi:phospholipase D-like domain-containing protein [soil metagenome]